MMTVRAPVAHIVPGMSKAGQLRALLAGEELIVAPGVYDGISAALVSKLGFSAAYMTGAGVVASAYGLPDIGLATLTEMADRARVLSGLLDIPVIADADTGYGSPVNVVRTVREYERAGVAAIQLEDQTFPKRCGHLSGKEVVDADAFARTLQAALEARQDPDTVIVADVIFVEAPRSEPEIERIAAEVGAPLLLNVVPGGVTPELTPARIRELGYRIAIYPVTVATAVVPAAVEALAALKPGTASGREAIPGPEEFFELFGLAAWQQLGDRYG
jgi:2-methylisocitrate lyase-like PEP mutase family enzyme